MANQWECQTAGWPQWLPYSANLIQNKLHTLHFYMNSWYNHLIIRKTEATNVFLRKFFIRLGFIGLHLRTLCNLAQEQTAPKNLWQRQTGVLPHTASAIPPQTLPSCPITFPLTHHRWVFNHNLNQNMYCVGHNSSQIKSKVKVRTLSMQCVQSI